MSSQSIYTQGPLNNRNFRLLYIHPAIDEHHDLVCSCFPFDIGDAPAYEALSYVWGLPQQPHEILCNGKVIRIQPSLSDALKRLRLPRTARVIWADAICINQGDNAEKSHQVPLMGSIYSRAERVVVWLGPGDPSVTQTAFNVLRYISRACHQYDLENGIDHKYTKQRHYAVRLPENVFSPAVCTDLEKLFEVPRFSRIWCVQEIRLARDALIFLGQDEIS
jgi:hypothetical protein